MQVGKFYQVPHVRAIWLISTPKWIPVIGPCHSDYEIIGFLPAHFHVDYRFLPKSLREEQAGYYGKSRGIDGIFGLPIAYAVPEIEIPPDMPTKTETFHPNNKGISLDYLPNPSVPLESYYRLIKSQLKAEYPEYPPSVEWLRALEEAYKDQTLKPGLICPHRGAPLEGMVPDSEGSVTCPLHGLRWNIETGRMANRVWQD